MSLLELNDPVEWTKGAVGLTGFIIKQEWELQDAELQWSHMVTVRTQHGDFDEFSPQLA